MEKDKIIIAFGELGEKLSEAADKAEAEVGQTALDGDRGSLTSLIQDSGRFNPWFTGDFVRYSMRSWAGSLSTEKVDRWLGQYPALPVPAGKSKKVGIVMAGNLPMVGLHDLLCVLASGHRAVVKLSGQDDLLIPSLLDTFIIDYPELKDRILFSGHTLKDIDAIIATGSNNTSRYFEYYFGKYPHIIRKNRNGVAVLDGSEDAEWLTAFADDIFLYFGLGCRNVSKVFLPEGYDIQSLLPHFEKYRRLSDHHKYFNNYEYQKSILLINNIPFHDNGFLIMKASDSIASAVSVLHYEFYQDIGKPRNELLLKDDQVQCVVTAMDGFERAVNAGNTQMPELWDYADGVDTMQFLENLS